MTVGSNVLGSFSAFCYKFCGQMFSDFLVYHVIDFVHLLRKQF